MTVAICVNCGTEKFGAFTPCHKCGFAPATPEDQAKSIALSDHNLSAEQLREIGQRIKAGEGPDFDEASITRVAEVIRQNPQVMRTPIGCAIAMWTPVIIMIILIMLVIAVFAYLKTNAP